jgi:O-methyltransferase involved in polyketide biosynthesis
MTFLLPLELIDAKERPQHQALHERARAAGTPFLSFFKPTEMLALANDAGFREGTHVSTADLTQRYFADRADGLKPTHGESFLVAVS